ncbi:MAG: hypothetical protein KDC84_04145 [Crocinitomicaceae bacterium]|nr:hypothetical protein [Crocinitomicaceae bacterium]
MLTIFISFFLIFGGTPQDEDVLGFNSLYEKDVEYLGLNFSKAKFIGTSHFTSGKILQEGYMNFWNDFVTNHYHKNNINNALNIDEMINHNSICGESYKKIDPYSLITDDPYKLRTDQIQECMDELEYNSCNKIGICFVVESFNFNAQTLTMWFTLVDMNKNQVFFQKKLITAVGKGKDRDLWANGITKYISKTLANSSKSWK